jgi:hypothetical protein
MSSTLKFTAALVASIALCNTASATSPVPVEVAVAVPVVATFGGSSGSGGKLSHGGCKCAEVSYVNGEFSHYGCGRGLQDWKLENAGMKITSMAWCDTVGYCPFGVGHDYDTCDDGANLVNPPSIRPIVPPVPPSMAPLPWQLPSALDAHGPCTSTYMSSGNTISCADGSYWTDNSWGRVRMTSPPTYPIVDVPLVPDTHITLSHNGCQCKETSYVDGQFNHYGCGTGAHDYILENQGYKQPGEAWCETVGQCSAGSADTCDIWL